MSKHSPIPLLAEIQAFLNSSGMSATTFGQRAIGNWQLVERLRAGGDVGTRTAAQIRTFIRDYRGEITPRPRSRRAA